VTVIRTVDGQEIDIGPGQVIIEALGGEPNFPPPAGMFGMKIRRTTMYWFDGRSESPTTEWTLEVQNPVTGVGRVKRRWP